MATLKEFEDALRRQGMTIALGILDGLRQRDRAVRRASPARRVTGRKMTAELARRVLELHGSTAMTQQEIAFKIGVNQGRVNEVIKHGKWLTDDPSSAEAQSRDKALAKSRRTPRDRLLTQRKPVEPRSAIGAGQGPGRGERVQLSFGGL